MAMSGDGNVFVYACCGHYARSLYTYTRSSTGWDQRGEFPHPPANNDKHGTGFFPGLDRVSTNPNGNAHDIFSVTLSDDGLTMAVGVDLGAADVSSDEMSGMHVRVFTWGGTTWDQKGGDIKPESDTDYFGWSVALSADATVVAVGDMYHSAKLGRVRVFEYDDTSYGWQLKGDPIDGHLPGGHGSYSVAMNAHGTVVAFGAPWGNTENGGNSGSVRVSEWTQTAGGGYAWQQLGADLHGDTYNQMAGYRVALSADGHTVAVSHPKDNRDLGFVRVHSLDASREWQPKGADLLGNAVGDDTGVALAMSGDGDIVAVGADRYDGAFADMGHVRVHGWDGQAWGRVGDDLEGLELYEYHGLSVGMSSNGHTIAVGVGDSHYNPNQVPRGHIRVYELKDYSPPPLPPAPLGGYAPPPPSPPPPPLPAIPPVPPIEGGYCVCETNGQGSGVLCYYPAFTTPTQALEWAAPDTEVVSLSYSRAMTDWHKNGNYESQRDASKKWPESDLNDPCSFEWEDAMARQGLINDYDRANDPVDTLFVNDYDADCMTARTAENPSNCQSDPAATILNNVGRIKHQGSGTGQDRSFYMPRTLKMDHVEFCDKYGCMCQNYEFCSKDGICNEFCTNIYDWDAKNYEPGPGKYYGETNQLCPQKAIDAGRVLNYRQHLDGYPFTNAIGAQGFGTSTPGGQHGKRQYCMVERPHVQADATTSYTGWLEQPLYPWYDIVTLTELAENYP
jgi:hypothetical protein